MRPTENKSSEPSTPVSCDDKPIVPSEPVTTFHEPDVIASTKNNGTVSIETDRPIAPPRRRRRKQTIENNGAKIEDNSNVFTTYIKLSVSYKYHICLFYRIYFIK